MSSVRDSQRIVIAGASSLLGAELKSLLEESRFAAADFRLLDEELAAGTLTEAGGEAAVIQPVEEDSFDRARFVFFTGSPEFTAANLPAARQSGATVIDLSGASLGAPETRLWYPRAELATQGERSVSYAVLSAPGTVTVTLLDALGSIGVYRIGLVFFRPVSEAGRAGIEELESQTSQLLSFQSVGQPVFDTQVAFSLLDRYGEESRESLSKVGERIRREVSPLVGKRGVEPSIQVLHAPVFYGYTFAALAETASNTTRERLAQICKEAGFLLHDPADGPLGNLACGDAFLHLALPEGDPPQSRGWWSWGAVDNIKLPAANAVKLSERLSG
jgi:aspartate-semialdehyde dehydrogenase